MAPNDFNDPNAKYNIIDLVTLKFSIHSESDSIKVESTQDRLHQVIGKGHLTHWPGQAK